MTAHLDKLIGMVVRFRTSDGTIHQGETIAAWIAKDDEVKVVVLVSATRKFHEVHLANCLHGPAPREPREQR